MDGLLLNTESLYFTSVNTLLKTHSHAPLPPSLKPLLMGISASTSVSIIHNWSKSTLALSRDELSTEILAAKIEGYRDIELLPGARDLLRDLKSARSAADGEKVRLALASSTNSAMFELKTSKADITETILGTFDNEKLRVLGDNPALGKGRGKPEPDIFLLALKAVNELCSEKGERVVEASECLVFEDSVAGVRAARRAGMRVVWVPQEEFLAVCGGREGEVLAGGIDGDEELVGEVGDGRGEQLVSLEGFEYEKYGIVVEGS